MWDIRTPWREVFEMKENVDFISDLTVVHDKKILIAPRS
jgi:hypothetical protein